MLRVAEVNIRIPEMQLEAEMELRIFSATREFFHRIVFQGIDAAEASQPIRETRDLLAGPIVFRFDPSILIFDGWFVWVTELVGDRQHYRTANSGRVQKCDEVTCFDPFKSWGQLPDGRTKKVLMVIHQWRRLTVQKRAREHGERTAKDSDSHLFRATDICCPGPNPKKRSRSVWQRSPSVPGFRKTR